MSSRTRTRPRVRVPAPVSESLKRLGERIRKARIEAGLSQSQLGSPHFTRAYVSALELGKIRPAMKSLEFLAAKLGKTAGFFLEDEEHERRRREREIDINAAAALVTRSTAADALARVGELIAESTSPSELARLRLMAGTAHNYLAQGGLALPELTAAERLAVQSGRLELVRAIVHQMAIAHRNLGELTRAKDLLLGLLKDAEESASADRPFRMRLLRDIGAVSWDLGEYEKSTAYYQSALEWARDVGDIASLTAVYHGLALSARGLGDLEGATSYLQKALGATQVSNDLAAAAILHNGLAVIAAERGHIEAAYRHVDRAIEIAKVTGPEAYVAHYLTTKAECAIKVGRLDEARSYALEALTVARQTSNDRGAAGAQVVLADVARRSGDLVDGEHNLAEAEAAYRRLGARQELGEVLIRLGEIASERGDAEAAQKYAAEAYLATRTTSALTGR